MDKSLQIKELIKYNKQSFAGELNGVKQELDNAIAKVEALEAEWNPITLTDAKESFKSAQTILSSVITRFTELQKRINGILKS